MYSTWHPLSYLERFQWWCIAFHFGSMIMVLILYYDNPICVLIAAEIFKPLCESRLGVNRVRKFLKIVLKLYLGAVCKHPFTVLCFWKKKNALRMEHSPGFLPAKFGLCRVDLQMITDHFGAHLIVLEKE